MSSNCYSCQVLMKFEYSEQIFVKSKISSFIKIRPVVAEFFHAAGWIDGHDETNSRFS